MTVFPIKFKSLLQKLTIKDQLFSLSICSCDVLDLPEMGVQVSRYPEWKVVQGQKSVLEGAIGLESADFL